VQGVEFVDGDGVGRNGTFDRGGRGGGVRRGVEAHGGGGGGGLCCGGEVVYSLSEA